MNKRILNTDVNSFRILIKAFSTIKNEKDIELFFKEIFTPQELNNLTLRWQLLEMLYTKQSQRSIASKLGISLCKITRGAKILKHKSVTKKILKNMEFYNEHISRNKHKC
ncbi:MAG: trp operon repressor [Endomicrobium sp.]|jgi:TrpR family trp operon transcriptional repressor|nr:trp operon repressor [Endomicrobium sp.]